jgi:hypothetical protein
MMEHGTAVKGAKNKIESTSGGIEDVSSSKRSTYALIAQNTADTINCATLGTNGGAA